MARSKVKSRSHYDIAHLHPLTNVPTKYQLPTPYGFRNIAQTRFYRSRSLWQGQRSYQGHIMTLHTHTPNQCPYQVSTTYTLDFLRYRKDKPTCQTSEKDILCFHPQGQSSTVHSLGGAWYFLSRQRDVTASSLLSKHVETPSKLTAGLVERASPVH